MPMPMPMPMQLGEQSPCIWIPCLYHHMYVTCMYYHWYQVRVREKRIQIRLIDRDCDQIHCPSVVRHVHSFRFGGIFPVFRGRCFRPSCGRTSSSGHSAASLASSGKSSGSCKQDLPNKRNVHFLRRVSCVRPAAMRHIAIGPLSVKIALATHASERAQTELTTFLLLHLL
jgi:hypothetical protein